MYKQKISEKIAFEDFFKKLSSAEKNICATRSYAKNDWKNFIAWDPVAKYEVVNKFSKKELINFVKNQQNKNRVIFGYISYDLAYDLFEIKQTAQDDIKIPKITFFAFDHVLEFKNNHLIIHASNSKTRESHQQEIARIMNRKGEDQKISTAPKSKWKSSMTKNEYAYKYNAIKNHITDGDIYQINLTHRLEAKTQKNARTLFVDVAQKNNVGNLAYIETDNIEIISASPERFIKISNNKLIETFPIKGTRPRGKTKKQDEDLKSELINSEKEAAELHMITDLMRNDIGKIAQIGSVAVKETRKMHQFKTVWHTSSHIQAKVKKNLSSIEALISMFPGGSITGCPKKRAIEIIDELEPTTRGVYTGSIGCIFPDDSLDFNIAIRTIIKKEDRAYLQVGGGIVYDSSEKDEYQETFDKAKSFLEVL